MEQLAGKIAVITGAGRGIGRRTAVRLAQMKVKTALVSRTETQLRETADLVLHAGGTPLVVAADLSNPKSIEAIKTSVIDELGQPSILINAAGMFGPIELVWKTDPTEWIKTSWSTSIGAYLMCHAFVGGMMARRLGPYRQRDFGRGSARTGSDQQRLRNQQGGPQSVHAAPGSRDRG